jgi:hypothetical protein
MRAIRWGRVLGFLEVGTKAGYWSPKVAATVADSIQQKWGLRQIRRRLGSLLDPRMPT